MSWTSTSSTTRLTLVILALTILAWGVARATTWTVCSSGCDFTLIQDAVDAATEDDTIQLSAETYLENVTVPKSLTIRGAGRMSTIVSGGYIPFSRVFTIDPHTESTFADMTIEKGWDVHGGGIGSSEFEEYFPLTLDNCILRDNWARWGGAIQYPGDVVITNTLITGNVAEYGGGAYLGSEPNTRITISNTIIANNSAVGYEGNGRGDAGGLATAFDADVTINATEITGNSAAYDLARRGRASGPSGNRIQHD